MLAKVSSSPSLPVAKNLINKNRKPVYAHAHIYKYLYNNTNNRNIISVKLTWCTAPRECAKNFRIRNFLSSYHRGKATCIIYLFIY